MATGENNGDSNIVTSGTEGESTQINFSEVTAAAQQLQQAISRFAQEDETNQEHFQALSQNSGSQPNGGNADAQIAQEEPDSAPLRGADQQLQASVLRFAQEHDKGDEGTAAVLSQMAAQLRTTDAKTQQNTAQIEKLGNWIRNNRH